MLEERNEYGCICLCVFNGILGKVRGDGDLNTWEPLTSGGTYSLFSLAEPTHSWVGIWPSVILSSQDSYLGIWKPLLSR